MNHKIHDNFLLKSDFKKVQEFMMGPYFPWYYNSGVMGDGHDEEEFQFTHIFYNFWKPESSYIKELSPLFEKIDPKAWIRIKANLTTKTTEHKETGFHTDFEFPCTTAIFYLNDTNGYTLFEDGTKVESVANRLVEFDSSLKHSGVTHTDEKVRVLINMNYFKEGGK